MKKPLNYDEIGRRINAVSRASPEDSGNFSALLKLGKMDPKTDLRFENWSELSFKGQDLRGFDFTGGNLKKCTFDGALIDGIRLEVAALNGANPEAAADYKTYIKNWRTPKNPPTDEAFSPGDEFFDSPITPRLTHGFIDADTKKGRVTIIARSREITLDDWNAAAEFITARNNEGLTNISIPDKPSAKAYARMISAITGKTYVAESAAKNWHFDKKLPDRPAAEQGKGLGFGVLRIMNE